MEDLEEVDQDIYNKIVDEHYDPNYNVKVPSKDKQDYSDVPFFTNYTDILNTFGKVSFELLDTESMGRGLFSTTTIPKGQTILVESAEILFLGDEPEDPIKDSTYHLVRSLYNQTAHVPPSFASQLAQTPTRATEFAKHVSEITTLLQNDATLLNSSYKITEEEVALIVNGIHTNSFLLDFHDGVAIFMYASLVNHSCSPNVGWHTVNNKMYFVALQDIPPSTQLYISYTFPALLSSRDKYFYSSYGFHCSCPLCSTKTDYWRAFLCDCGGYIFPINKVWKCNSCGMMLNSIKKPLRYKPCGKVADAHIRRFKSFRAFAQSKKCFDPIKVYEKTILPISKYYSRYVFGRIYASTLEEYAVVCIRYVKELKDDIKKYPNENLMNQQDDEHLMDFILNKAKLAFWNSYLQRCNIGLGVGGYAAQSLVENVYYLEHIEDINKRTPYEEW
ncbi:Set and mynd domain containing protein [Entamoeba marina]